MIPESTEVAVGTEDRPNGLHAGALPATPVGRDHRVVRIVATAAMVVAVSYILFQRIGTTAQADLIEFTQNVSGGFMAVGMTETDSGFVVLSALNQESVDVRADHYSNLLAGDFTVAEVRTPQSTWHARLRGPVVVVVDPRGFARGFPIDWSLAQFTLIRDGVDCAHEHGAKHRRCGAPFSDLSDLIADKGISGVPFEARQFLTAFARPRK